MANNFYVNGTSLVPKVFANLEGNTTAVTGANQVAVVNADLTSINGATSIDQAGTTFTQHGLVYAGGKNITTTKDLSILHRVKFVSLAASQALFSVGGFGRDPQSNIEIYINNAGNIRAYMYNDSYLRGINNHSFGTSLSTGTWYDIFITWVNSTKTLELFVDGVSQGTDVSSRDFTSFWSYQNMTQIMLGMGDTSSNCELRTDEFAIWDSIEDPTATGLNFNGASRSSYFGFTPTVALSDPGVANVRSGTSYGFGGSSLTGTMAVPSADDVRQGVSVDGGTGNLTLPSVNDVQDSVDFGTDGTEFTGNLELPTEIQVEDGVGFGSNGTEFTGSLATADLPGVNDVRLGVVYGQSASPLTGALNTNTSNALIAEVDSNEIEIRVTTDE